MMTIRSFSLRLIVGSSLLCASGISASAAPPDLTAGEVPGNTVTINLGPTGLRGWIHHEGSVDTSTSRQILITAIDAGSPADGVLSPDDVILGADGTGANPAAFSSDARRHFGLAIAEAEARDPGVLKLLRWRDGATSTVNITLETLGAYNASAPYSCPKSALILEQGADHVFNNESSGRYSFGNMSLLATGNPAYAAQVRSEARSLVPSAATMATMMSNAQDTTPMVCWESVQAC